MNRRTVPGWWLLVVLCLAVHLPVQKAQADRKVGMLLWSAETRYLETRAGILDQLRKEGFGESAVRFILEVAEESRAKLADSIRRLAEAKPELVLTVGTVATLAFVKGIGDVPVVFSTVYDPVAAGIATGWKSSGNNTTGASTRIPMSSLVRALKEVAPVKRLAVLYTPGEKQTEIQLMELQKVQANYRIKVLPVIVTRKEEVAPTLTGILPTVDALFLTGSSIVGAVVPAIVDMAGKGKVPTITSLSDVVNEGALLGVCANPYRNGRLSGKKAARVLRGARPSSIPIETDRKADLILNMKTVRAGGFQMPNAFMKRVTKVVE